MLLEWLNGSNVTVWVLVGVWARVWFCVWCIQYVRFHGCIWLAQAEWGQRDAKAACLFLITWVKESILTYIHFFFYFVYFSVVNVSQCESMFTYICKWFMSQQQPCFSSSGSLDHSASPQLHLSPSLGLDQCHGLKRGICHHFWANVLVLVVFLTISFLQSLQKWTRIWFRTDMMTNQCHPRV